jgi:DNA-binding MurR/RpiR family transcriptional regulator
MDASSLNRMRQQSCKLLPSQHVAAVKVVSAALIIAKPETVVYMSITDFSEACGVSEGTIVVFCRRSARADSRS